MKPTPLSAALVTACPPILKSQKSVTEQIHCSKFSAQVNSPLTFFIYEKFTSENARENLLCKSAYMLTFENGEACRLLASPPLAWTDACAFCQPPAAASLPLLSRPLSRLLLLLLILLLLGGVRGTT